MDIDKQETINVIACFTSFFDLSLLVISNVLLALGPIFGTESLLVLVLTTTLTMPLALTLSATLQIGSTPHTSLIASSSSTSLSTISEPAYSFSYDNTSLEDRDSICTCSSALIRTLTTTFTLPGRLGNICLTILLSKELISSTTTESLTITTTIATAVLIVLEATYTAMANIANTVVTIWTNYITDSRNALKAKEINDCLRLAS
jgi:hypothetical protein